MTVVVQQQQAPSPSIMPLGRVPRGTSISDVLDAPRPQKQKPAVSRRVGWDGRPRTLQQFIDHYGFLSAADEWCRASSVPVAPPAPSSSASLCPSFRSIACSEAGSESGTSTHGISDISSSRGSSCGESECEPPWLRGAAPRQGHPVQLGDEVRSFAAFVSLSAEEAASRSTLRSALQGMAQQYWPEATVKLYGSFAYSLSLPSSSVDIVIEDCGADVADNLPAFFDYVAQSGYEVLCSTAAATDGGVRLRNARTGLTANVTILAAKSRMRQSVVVVKHYLARFPAAKAVLLVVRTVLAQCNLGGSMPGGLSAYALTLMVFNFFLARYSPEEAARKDAGDALLDFLTYYGSEFDFQRHSVSIPAMPAAPLPCFERNGRGEPPLSPRVHEGGCISICDPLNPSCNVAASFVKLVQLRSTFKHCHAALVQWSRCDSRGRTQLSCVVAVKPRQETGATPAWATKAAA